MRAVGWVGLLASLGLTLALVGVFATHRGDQGAYLQLVHRYGNPQHRVAADLMPADQTLVQVGDRACDWLAHQPPALWRRAEHYQPGYLDTQYASGSADTADLQAAGLRPESVIEEAWSSLCPATGEIVLPHYQALHGSGGD